MNKHLLIIILSLFTLFISCSKKEENTYMGSRSCRECHQDFYELWESSFHGRAMREVNNELLSELKPCNDTIHIGNDQYMIYQEKQALFLYEYSSNASYALELALGGKYVYYFLTPFENGKWQTAALGYDLKSEEWFDITNSSLRMHQDQLDAALDWKDRRYTFNSACYDCHVSQLNNTYHLSTDSYTTSWLEPGINCETCHGPAEKHNRVFQHAAENHTIPDSTFIKTFTRDRGYHRDIVDASCVYCHAKNIRITKAYIPGEDYFEHFDLICADNADYYPDARDLGENYTYGSWLMSPCREDERMDCLHCHTSSGRFRQKDDPNSSCLPCHADRVANASQHTHHRVGSPGNECIACHMPQTTFARMQRSDHSMRPPVPAMTRLYDSPNACNDCHTSQSSQWAELFIREHFSGKWQDNTLEYAAYLDRLRNADASALDEILPYMLKPMDEFSLSSLIRALDNVEDPKIASLLYYFLKHESALVRSSAASGLGKYRDQAIDLALLKATQDSIKVVRIRAIAEILDIAENDIPPEYKQAYHQALKEYESSLRAYPAEESSHFNLGQFHEMRQDPNNAIKSYRNALKLRPELSQAANNAAMIYYESGMIDSALYLLQEAVNHQPNNAAVYQNLGILYAELGYHDEAIIELKTAMQIQSSAIAAYNLAVIYTARIPQKSLEYAALAYELDPISKKYAYTYAYYLSEQGEIDQAIKILKTIDSKDFNSYYLLSLLYKNSGMEKEREKLIKMIKRDKSLNAKEKGLLR